MTKIYKDAKNVPVAAIIIYPFAPDDGDVAYAYKDPEHTEMFSKDELRDAYLNGAQVSMDNMHEEYNKPISYCEYVNDGYSVIGIWYDDHEETVSYHYIQSAADSE